MKVIKIWENFIKFRLRITVKNYLINSFMLSCGHGQVLQLLSFWELFKMLYNLILILLIIVFDFFVEVERLKQGFMFSIQEIVPFLYLNRRLCFRNIVGEWCTEWIFYESARRLIQSISRNKRGSACPVYMFPLGFPLFWIGIKTSSQKVLPLNA